MSLWCDKHRPKTLNGLDYHKEQAEQLKKLVKYFFIIFLMLICINLKNLSAFLLQIKI
jgi:hypothetical protein